MSAQGKIFSLNVLSTIGGVLLFIFTFYSCEKIEPERATKVTTGSVTNINSNSCMISGTILDISDNSVDQHGFCWSTNQNPGLSDYKTQLGSKSAAGIFTDDIAGLTPEKKYYIRAYAQNDGVLSYGNEKSFTTTKMIVIPTLSTSSVSIYSETSATVGGYIIADGGDAILERGVYYSTSPGAETGTKLAIGNGTGVFSTTLTGLTPGTIYFVRAYATNNIGTNYGEEFSFITIEIGTSFQGGKVVHIFQAGDPGYKAGETHGLIVAPTNQGTEVEWGCRGTEINGADGMALGTGNQNTLEILAGCSTSGIAASLCGDLVLDGFSDWYLPSIDELIILYDNREIISGFGSYTYWGSTENNDEFAAGINFFNGGGTSAKKSDLFAVRAVRTF